MNNTISTPTFTFEKVEKDGFKPYYNVYRKQYDINALTLYGFVLAEDIEVALSDLNKKPYSGYYIELVDNIAKEKMFTTLLIAKLV